jgi:hypothetical protein
MVRLESILNSERKPLKSIFMHYAIVDESPLTIARLEGGMDYNDKHGRICHVMTWKMVVKFLQDFDIVPALLQRHICQRLFDAIALDTLGWFAASFNLMSLFLIYANTIPDRCSSQRG